MVADSSRCVILFSRIGRGHNGRQLFIIFTEGLCLRHGDASSGNAPSYSFFIEVKDGFF
ncbi:hypothetical protein DSUL_30053 [Desulfovibrionales bacterium]